MRRCVIAAGILLLALTGTWSTAMAAPAAPGCSERKDLCLPPPSAMLAGSASEPRTLPDGAAATLTVEGRLNSHYLKVANSRVVAVRRLMLHVTGSGFIPGSTVRIAVMNTSTWTGLATASIHTQGTVVSGFCPGDPHPRHICTKSNPAAGTIDGNLRLDDPPALSNLEVLYQSAGRAGIHEVVVR